MSEKKRGIVLPPTSVFASFFGAFLVACVFAYNNYRFSKYKFIDFDDLVFYEKSEIFKPKSSEFLLVVFSSNMSNFDKILENSKTNLPIVAVDIFQKRLANRENLSYITSDINTILKLMNTLNITSVPSSVRVVHQNKKIYKQDSKINKI